MKRTPKKSNCKKSNKRTKRSNRKRSHKNKKCKKSHITYKPKSRTFVLSQNISRHQCSSFLGNRLNPTLTQFISPTECKMCN